MFFIFQLISDPLQPGANLFRANIQKALNVLNPSNDIGPSSRKSRQVLDTLKPLYEAEFGRLGVEEKERLKARVLNRVRALAFPYHGKGESESMTLDATTSTSLRVKTPISSIRDSLVDSTASSSSSSSSTTQYVFDPQMDWTGITMDNDAEMDLGMSLGFGEGEWMNFLEMMKSAH